jgi:hypothetical protein
MFTSTVLIDKIFCFNISKVINTNNDICLIKTNLLNASKTPRLVDSSIPYDIKITLDSWNHSYMAFRSLVDKTFRPLYHFNIQENVILNF